MATFILGDVHGRYKALTQVFERAKFNEADLLISLGDIVDRGDEPFECIEYLKGVKNKILIMGNHDQNFYDYTQSGHDGFRGHSGVDRTIPKWRLLSTEAKNSAVEFFESQIYYHIQDNKCFVHGGFDRDHFIKDQDSSTHIWDRELWTEAMCCKGNQKLKTKDKFDTIYIGHTPTIIWKDATGNPINWPLHSGGVWNLDTGAGFPEGKLTLMNLDSGEYYQSNLIKELYE